MYSYYQFRPHQIKITKEGYLKGGVLTFVFAWIDWSFLRELVAPHYSDTTEGGWLWDPVTLVLLDLLRVLLHRDGRTDLLDELRDETPLGGQIAQYVGIDLEQPRHADHVVPNEMAFTHLRQRIGPAVYEGMMQVVVGFLRQLQVITFEVLAFDSMLVDTWAVFNGCKHAGQAGHGCQSCVLFKECQRVPFDLEAGVGHRVNPDNPQDVTVTRLSSPCAPRWSATTITWLTMACGDPSITVSTICISMLCCQPPPPSCANSMT